MEQVVYLSNSQQLIMSEIIWKIIETFRIKVRMNQGYDFTNCFQPYTNCHTISYMAISYDQIILLNYLIFWSQKACRDPYKMYWLNSNEP